MRHLLLLMLSLNTAAAPGAEVEPYRQAVEADPRSAKAHYALAAQWGRMRQAGKVCETGVERNAIAEELTKAVLLDPSLKARAAKDAAFDAIRDTVAYQRLFGADPATKKGLEELLVATRYWEPGNGAHGSRRELAFRPGGKLELTTAADPAGGAKAGTATGTWAVAAEPGRGYVIRVKAPGLEATLYLEGVELKSTAAADAATQAAFSNDPDECSL